MLRLYFHLFASLCLIGMGLWLIKDLWYVMLIVLIPLYLLRIGRKGSR